MDPSAKFLARVGEIATALSNVEVHRADAYQTRLADSCIDHIHARWLFCFLDRPEVAAAEMARVLKPGGTVLILDYFNYQAFSLAPRSAAMEVVVDAIRKYWLRSHGSLDIQGIMPGLLSQAGLHVESIANVSQIVTPDTPLWQWPRRFLFDYLPQLETAGLLNAAAIEEFWNDWHAAEKTPGSYLFLPPMIEVIARKP